MSDLEGKFYKYMRFDDSVLSERYAYYLPFFKDKQNILDIGCGKGHFLELLKKHGKKVRGVDNDAELIKYAKDKGIAVVISDAFDFLKKEKARYDGIFCSHVIEHLSTDDVIKLFGYCYRLLEPEGVIVVAAPNPACLYTQLYEFWRDPTHVRMYNKELIAFLLSNAGFQVTASGENEFHRIYSGVDFRSKNKTQFRKVLRRLRGVINKENRFTDIIMEQFNFPEIFASGQKEK